MTFAIRETEKRICRANSHQDIRLLLIVFFLENIKLCSEYSIHSLIILILDCRLKKVSDLFVLFLLVNLTVFLIYSTGEVFYLVFKSEAIITMATDEFEWFTRFFTHLVDCIVPNPLIFSR